MWQGSCVGQSGKATWRRNPRRSVDRPVPPPIATTRRGADEEGTPGTWELSSEAPGRGEADFEDEPGVTKCLWAKFALRKFRIQQLCEAGIVHHALEVVV